MERPFAVDFDAFNERVWLDTAHQGPLPKVAAQAAREAVEWKTWPHLLTQNRFTKTPRDLRSNLARLLNANQADLVLGNSASYGLHLLANGLPLRAGDEVLLVAGDFPASILPWLALRERGVNVRLIQPKGNWLSPEELAKNLIGTTRVFCASWVHSFSGAAMDVKAIGELCKDANVDFILNGSQAIGTRPFNVSEVAVDAVVGVGFKWLLGPYGTGYTWLHPTLREKLKLNHCYWLNYQSAVDMETATDFKEPTPIDEARRFDVFATANFINFHPWNASLVYLLEQGLDNIYAHNQMLIDQILQGLDPKRFRQVVNAPKEERSNLLCLETIDLDPSTVHRSLRQRGIDIAMRQNRLRISPHLFNTIDQIAVLTDRLNAMR